MSYFTCLKQMHTESKQIRLIQTFFLSLAAPMSCPSSTIGHGTPSPASRAFYSHSKPPPSTFLPPSTPDEMHLGRISGCPISPCLIYPITQLFKCECLVYIYVQLFTTPNQMETHCQLNSLALLFQSLLADP